MAMMLTMITNSDLTIYNKYIDGTTRNEKYQRTTITGVMWQSAKASSAKNGGLLASNTATIFLPFARGTQYKEPQTWLALATKTGYWTLKEGDILVKGIVTDEITSLFTATNLKAKYNNVVIITSVDSMDMGSADMQHWQVGAK